MKDKYINIITDNNYLSRYGYLIHVMFTFKYPYKYLYNVD